MCSVYVLQDTPGILRDQPTSGGSSIIWVGFVWDGQHSPMYYRILGTHEEEEEHKRENNIQDLHDFDAQVCMSQLKSNHRSRCVREDEE